jgi:hypothetical protein
LHRGYFQNARVGIDPIVTAFSKIDGDQFTIFFLDGNPNHLLNSRDRVG